MTKKAFEESTDADFEKYQECEFYDEYQESRDRTRMLWFILPLVFGIAAYFINLTFIKKKYLYLEKVFSKEDGEIYDGEIYLIGARDKILKFVLFSMWNLIMYPIINIILIQAFT